MVRKYVVVTEHDTTDWRESHGAIINETYLCKASLHDAISRKNASSRYGRSQIAELLFLSDEDIESRKYDRDKNKHVAVDNFTITEATRVMNSMAVELAKLHPEKFVDFIDVLAYFRAKL